MQVPYSSSSIPLNLSSSRYTREAQLFGDSNVNQDLATRPLDLGCFAANTFTKQNMRLSGGRPQEVGPKRRAKRKTPRPKNSRPPVASPISDSSNVPDIETFLQAQEYLGVALKFEDTLPQSRKKGLIEVLGISAAQLESCIKAKHEILPTLNDLISATVNLGLPTDHVVRWLETIDARNSTNKSTTDSAYQSQLTKLGGRNTPKKKRKLNEGDEIVSKPYECTRIDSDDEYCLHEFTTFTDWKRHEETHWPQKRWECLIQGSNTTASCHICSGNIDLAGHQLVNNHAGCVAGNVRKGHSFPRKDKLMLHVKEKHDWNANIDNWYEDLISNWKRQCGFCGSMFTMWDARCEHVGQHFLEGKRMTTDWKDPWRSDSVTFGQDGDDDDDDNNDNNDDAGGNEDNHDNIYEADFHNCADKDHEGPGNFRKDTSNEDTGSNHERQRQSTSFKSDHLGEVNGDSRESEKLPGKIANYPSDPYSPRHQRDQGPTNVFKYIRKLGYGNFGAVDEVEHRASRIHFARKTIRFSPNRSASSLAQAQREVTALRRLKHPHIINILASYGWDGHLAIIMFPVAERNLSEFLFDKNATTLHEISKLSVWLGCLTSAVSYIHGNSCYHMDIKPHNILIYGSHVMLADFGGALITEKSQPKNTFESTSIISPMYCAPEITSSGASRFMPGAGDIFSLGCVFLEMVTVMHREKLPAFVEFRTFGSRNATYSSDSRKIWIWIKHLSYINESLGFPQQNWLKIIRSMLSVDSKQRPTAQDIIHSYLIDNFQEKREKTDEEKYLVVSNSNGSLSLIDAARLWLAECRTSHERCCEPMSDFVPSRILDVGTYSDSIHLQRTLLGWAGPYVTLSHCWGGGEILKTTKQTLKTMKSGIQISSLPATFAAAVQLTRALGFKYLWIDSLCIIQDSREDWMTESSQMGKIYSHSSLTISADSGGAYSPNIEPRMLYYQPVLSKPKPLSDSCSSGHTGLEFLSDDTATTMLLDSPLSTRAWTLQERILSPRVLYFSSKSMAWECNSSYTTFDTAGQIGKALRLQFAQKATSSDPNIHLSDLPIQLLSKPMKMWRDIVREYSRRKLTFAQDKLPALAGLVSKLSEKTGYTYVAGLWLQDLLPTGLLWFRDFATTPLIRPRYRAPSWSWASIDSHVAWSKSLPEGNLRAKVEIIQCEISLLSKRSPFGAISGGCIEIKGSLKRVTVARIGSEQLLKKPSSTPFAFAQWDALEDEDGAAALDGGEQNQSQVLWCLSIIEGVGLILREKKPECFERVGLFWIQDDLVEESKLHDIWEPRTVTIV